MNWFFPPILVLVFLPFSVASGQVASKPSTNPPLAAAASVSGRLVTLDVRVVDKSGAPIRGLQKEDFTLLDDKQPQNIVSFHAVTGKPDPSDPLVEVVLVVDGVNAGFHAVTYERGQMRQYLLRNGGELPHPVSLVVFTDAGTRVQNGSSQDGKALAALYEQYETGLRSITRSQGIYGAAERFDLSLRALTSLIAYLQQVPGRKLLVWISPGWPLLTGPGIEYSAKDEQRMFRSIVRYSTSLRQARITLYAVDPLGLADAGGNRITYYEEFLKGVVSPSRTDPADLALQVLAVQSGGAVFNSSNDLASSIAGCVSDADGYYVLAFESAAAEKPDEYHSIEVKVDKPRAIARTRTGYYAQP